MNTPNTPEIRPYVAIIHGEIRATSLKVAEHFGKNHKEVLRAIENLECSAEFGRRNFAPSSYKNTQNKLQPMYEITKNGFAFLGFGFTGQKPAMVGGVGGSRKACRNLVPVCQAFTSSATLGLEAPVGGYSPQDKEQSA